MKRKATNYEVLLFTRTSFSKKELCDKNCQQPAYSPEEQLEAACWNGLIFEILADIVQCPQNTTGCYTWEVIPAKNFIDIKVGEAPYSIEHGMSLNPYFYLPRRNLN